MGVVIVIVRASRDAVPPTGAGPGYGHNGGPPLDDEPAKPKRQDPGFGQMLREIRQETGLSQHELAARSGISRGALRKIESHGRGGHAETIARLAQALGYDLDLVAVEPLAPRERTARRAHH